MRYYIISGEASGDLHASNLIHEIKAKDPSAEFRGWGGDMMAAEGCLIVKHYRDLAFMGFAEVLMNIRTILSNIRFCKQDILDYSPDVVIFVDYPGFNLRIAEFAHEKGFKTVYYISPQVWAWKESRVNKIKKVVDLMLVILPFEQDFYRKHGYESHFVGHPLLDAIEKSVPAPGSIPDSDPRPIIALLPGSRKQEIASMLPVMLATIHRFPDYRFILAAAPSQELDYYRSMIGTARVEIVKGDTYGLLRVATAALVTSGTATLETALFRVPEVVCYKANPVSYRIARALVKIKYISLVNLIMDREVVKELIQDNFNIDDLCLELEKILSGHGREKMLADFSELRCCLGGPGASGKAADLIIGFSVKS